MISSAASAAANSGPSDLECRAAHRERLVAAADVGDDEYVQNHHRAGVHDHLRGRDKSARSSRNSAASEIRWKTSASTL